MCGIISYIGKNDAVPKLIEGIKRLEYRGYDSFGCALMLEEGIKLIKGVGHVTDVIENNRLHSYKSSMALFHTRWATHGGIEERNTHPHSDCSGNIVVAHNGIIENYESLKETMSSHNFMSETDTEVIPHLIEDYMGTGLTLYDSVSIVAEKLKGASSFVVLDASSHEVVCVKNGSPLIMAIEKNGYFASSDVPSVLPFTNKIVYLHDGDIIRMSEKGFEIRNILKENLEHPIYEVDMETYKSEKGKYHHFMEKEIYEQLGIWASLPKFDLTSIKEAAYDISHSRRTYIVGSGTSYYASALGAKMLRGQGIDSLAIEPQEFDSYKNIVNEKDIFVIISQSGETADIISYIEEMAANKIIGIINVPHSYLSERVDILIEMKAGLEKAVASTKSMTNSLIILTLLSLAVGGNTEKGIVDANLLALNEFNLAVPAVVNAIETIAEFLKDENRIFIAGKGLGFLLAQEGALKLKEVTYIHAEALDLASLKHGPLALIEPGTKVMVIITEESREDSMYNLEELKARGATIVGLSTTNSPKFDMFIRTVRAGIFEFAPILFTLQLLSYKIAVKKNIDPDKPRNLAKSVTVK